MFYFETFNKGQSFYEELLNFIRDILSFSLRSSRRYWRVSITNYILLPRILPEQSITHIKSIPGLLEFNSGFSLDSLVAIDNIQGRFWTLDLFNWIALDKGYKFMLRFFSKLYSYSAFIFFIFSFLSSRRSSPVQNNFPG
jgi:hypothetical protein